MNTVERPYEALLHRAKEWTLLQSCSNLLGWDQQTMMPPRGTELRGEQTALLATLVHDRMTDPKLQDWIAEAEAEVQPDNDDGWREANLRELKHTISRAAKLPRRLVEAIAKATTSGQQAWVQARQQNSYQLFQPHLQTILELKREEAAAIGYEREPYDALLDEYEPGTTAAQIEPIFKQLKQELSLLLRQIIASGKAPPVKLLEREVPIERQKFFAESAAQAIGFRFTEGRLDTAAHPFCSGIGPGDCRLTIRYDPKNFAESFFGVLHEAGHGIYEQNLPADRFGQPAATFCSLGIHESQSRFWENQIGRSETFWQTMFPRLQQSAPGTFDDVNRDEFLLAINHVQPSFIRVESDEVTYNLHIALRFELERAMLRGDLQPADLPNAWNEQFQQLFGLPVPSDREGCLQDIHWSFGGLGYFPTYTLGNLYAAQFMAAAKNQIPDLDDELARGGFSRLTAWLNRVIHAQGRKLRAEQLCEQVTGSGPDPKFFLDYLREKVCRLYGIC